MRKLFLMIGLVILPGCASNGTPTPLIFCDRPADINARVFTNCTPRVDDRV
ncbi:hypothetical protein [Phyllobacterium endophyticum]|uniref:hypothetical protein n=1 Tax=Phyllobacterium endophyticum TaxID=1149773 RepID=UPI0014754B03|nr:hypothetical protein [Phyllobacterium endophyticum]MBB3234773.1 hypothetical protein [Phyllobacterium endophyticum]